MDVETGGGPFSPTPTGTLLLVTQGQLYRVLVSARPGLRPLQDCHNGAPSSSEIWPLCGPLPAPSLEPQIAQECDHQI